MKAVEIEISIDAPLELVWDTLLRIEEYPLWNPFIQKVECTAASLVVGSIIDLHVHWPSGRKEIAREQICTIERPGEKDDTALWEYTYEGILARLYLLQAKRVQRLSKGQHGVTIYYSADFFKGIGRFLVPFREVKEGFLLQAEGLKKYCERKSKELPLP